MQAPTTLEQSADGLRTEHPFGIRFRLSVILLLAALNLVAMVTVLVWSAPIALRDERPAVGAAWEASRRLDAFHLQMMVDAIAAREGAAEAPFPEAEFGQLREALAGNLGDEYGYVEPSVEYLYQVTRRWYQDGQPIPAGYVIELPDEEDLVPLLGPAEEEWDELGGPEDPELETTADDGAEVAEPGEIDDGAVPPIAADAPAEAGMEPGGEADTALVSSEGVDPVEAEEVFRELQLAHYSLQDVLAQRVASHLVESSTLLRPLLGYAIAWISAMAALFIYFSFRLRTVFSVPLGKVMRSAVSIGHGNLDTPVEVPAHRSELETLAVVLDTMRANLKHQLAERELEFRRMSTLLNSMREGVLLVDRDWALQLYNPSAAKLLAMGDNPAFRVGMDVRSLGVSALGKTPDRMEYEGSTELLAALTDAETGRERHTRITRSPLTDAREEYVGYVAVIRDITQEKEMEQMKNDFFSMVTHELKTPLTPIEGYTKLLIKGRSGPVTEQQVRFLNIIASQTTLLKGMIQDLLDMSRIAAGRLSLNVGSVEIVGMVERVVERFAPQAFQQGIELVLTLDDHDSQLLRGDEMRLEQVLGNLIGNALKFTPSEGTITVVSSVQGDSWTARVVDTGKGIPRAVLARIFEKFYQVEKGDTRSAGGAGLGLFICREIVAMHGGTISVESEVGEGTEFTVTAPIDGPPDAADTL
jgi:two-component system, OmpR family, sensor histidine kinase ResE